MLSCITRLSENALYMLVEKENGVRVDTSGMLTINLDTGRVEYKCEPMFGRQDFSV